MNQRLLIILGLVIIPFYEIILKALPFVRSVAPDSRVTKEILALVFALSIGLLAVFNGHIKQFRNKFLLIIPLFLLFNLIASPHIPLIINSYDSGDFYFWKPFSQVMCFSLMIIAIASMEIDFTPVIKTMVICGTVMAGYALLQKIGLDQFWMVKHSSVIEGVRNCSMGGNLGQYSILASWLVMMVPLAMYLKEYWYALTIVIATILTTSNMAIIALVIIFLITIFHLYKELQKPLLIFLTIMGLFFIFGFMHNKSFKDKIINKMDGRYQVWQETIQDIKTGQLPASIQTFPYTGVGLGRFSFLFHQKHGGEFGQAHNDILEFTYDCGLIGAFLLLAGLFIMAHRIVFDSLSFSILLSFIAIFICSLGSFPFQLGAHQFYAAVLVGILNNGSIIRRTI